MKPVRRPAYGVDVENFAGKCSLERPTSMQLSVGPKELNLRISVEVQELGYPEVSLLRTLERCFLGIRVKEGAITNDYFIAERLEGEGETRLRKGVHAVPENGEMA